MTKEDLKLNTDETLIGFVSVNSVSNCYKVESYTKKELTDRDCYYLRYCLMRFIENNQGNIIKYIDDDVNTIYYNVDREASICDASLYIGNFEGYNINDDLTLKIRDIELDVNNRVIVNIYNSDNDSYTSYLID